MRKTHVEKKHQGGRIALYVISMVLLLGVFSGLLYLRWEKPPEMIIAEADGPETTEAIEKSAPAEPEETRTHAGRDAIQRHRRIRPAAC